MAVKSPGIYFTEIDNTQYENPKSVSGTTLAIVGYASKGPIGVPTRINDWLTFKEIFGDPINGYYSGLAVNKFLSSGGSVLFLRVADGTASPSNYVVKNPVPERKGYITFSRRENISATQLRDGYLYTFKLSNSEGVNKHLFIRPPKKGLSLKQVTVANQIAKQLGATPAEFEGTITNSIGKGLYGFKVNVNNGNKAEDLTKNNYYIETYENETKKDFVESLNNAIKYGSNAVVSISIDAKAKDDGNVNVNEEGTDYSEIISGEKKFKFKKNGEESEITVSFTGDTITLDDIADAIDKKMEDYNIRVIAVHGTKSAGQIRSKLLFISKTKEKEEQFEILGYNREDESFDSSLFFAQEQKEPGGAGKAVSTGGEFDCDDTLAEAPKHLYVCESGYSSIKAEAPTDLENRIEADYDEILGNYILRTKGTGSKTTINITDCEDSARKNSLSFTKGGLFTKVFNLKGQDAIDVTVEQNNGEIKFVSAGITAPSLAPNVTDDFVGGDSQNIFLDFLELERAPGDVSGKGYDDPVQGNVAIKAEARDKVIFTSREVGSGTNNIVVEVFSTPISFDSDKMKHNIYIFSGNKKESFENVSFDPNNEKYFVNLINRTPENGGSSFIKAEGIKKVFEEGVTDIELPDGKYKLGIANKEGDRAKLLDVLIEDYDTYEYAVGTNGIPEEEGNLLFMEAMKPGTSALANKDLYDFHILIAPDDITQDTQDACIKLCEDREDAITIIDPPQGLNKKSVIDWHNGRGAGRNTPVDSNYAAIYWPWCKVIDDSNKIACVMPSVVMASKYVNVDVTSGCHMAPAGERNGQLPVINIEQYPNKLDRDELYTGYNRINPLVNVMNKYIMAYGEKTTQRTDSVLTKIHVRRMLIQIKKQCREALRGYIFMPNTVDYLGRISNNITAILESYKTKGGLSFYKVICDETNNPTEVRQQDIINVDVVLVPEGTIEEININLTLNKSAETISD